MSTATLRYRPIIMVNTGDGKGKTTAAMGVALRTWAKGHPVGVFQFIKSGKWKTGEQLALAALATTDKAAEKVVWENIGQGWSWSKSKYSEAEKAKLASQGWNRIQTGMAAQEFRLWILDEFTYPMNWGWIDPNEVAETLVSRPGYQNVIITGRNCPKEILAIANLVTEMKKVKHPFDIGQRGQAGIEW